MDVGACGWASVQVVIGACGCCFRKLLMHVVMSAGGYLGKGGSFLLRLYDGPHNGK